jgi:hypothetical protein
LAIFSFKQDGVTVSAAGIPLVASSLAFQTYMESSIAEQIRTGFAVGNPSSSPVTANLELTTLEGAPTGLFKSVQIPANGQMAIFLDEIMPSVPDEFKGVLRLTAESPIATVGLRGRVNERGNFIFTTVPVADDAGSVVPPVETIFPHIVNGGGYTTQLVLLGSGADGSASGSVLFFGKDGTLLTLQPN